MATRLHASGYGNYDGDSVSCKRVRLWRKMSLISEIILVIRMWAYSPDTAKFAGEFEMDIVFFGGGVFSIYVPCVLRDYLKEGCVYIVIVTDDKTGRDISDEPDIILVEVQQLLGSKNGFRNMLEDYDRYWASIAPAA
jgi:hypothetical protein